MLLLVTPPFTQLNTPYPATTQLKAFLRQNGVDAEQVDLGIEVINDIYSSRFLSRVLPAGVPLAKQYVDTVDSVMRYLRGDDSSQAVRIASRSFLPEGGRFRDMTDLEWAFGVSGVADKARYLATLYMEDIADMLRKYVDQRFDIVRYAEKISIYAESFDELENALNQQPSPIETLMLQRLEKHLQTYKPSVVCFTVPFPGCLFSTLRCGQYIKSHHPDIKICVGGGFPNTEWRSLSEPRIFEYVDFITLDDGELPLLRIVRYLDGRMDSLSLLRTYRRIDGKVEYIDRAEDTMPNQVVNDELPAPDFSNLPLNSYISLCDIANPMQRLWSDMRWNKMMMAHGCYWAKCAFCDTKLDYICRYDAPKASTVVTRMERIMEQTGCSGFHFVDEALPPALLKAVCEEILRRGLNVSFWGNIRFEKSYDTELCNLLADAGCIAVSGGLEVASDRLLQKIGKGVTVGQTFRAARNFRDAGIMVHIYLMYGFPTETLEETMDALENVRKMFAEGVVQSAFWHRYAMTAHSPSGNDPHGYGAESLWQKPDDGTPLFCINEIPFRYDFGYDLDAVGEVLRVATYNFMNGMGLDMTARQWFRQLFPKSPKKKRHNS